MAVLDYPARIPTLAATAADGVHAQRWELYLGGVEVANCFQEETDRAALGRRGSERGWCRARTLADVRPSPRSGVAVGIDRCTPARPARHRAGHGDSG